MALRKHNKVFTVFSFLRLSSADIRWYQWTYPTALFLVVVVGFHWLGSVWLVYDTDKLVADLNSLMGILVGFYIAALAAVSSFTNENLDQAMKGRAPTLTTSRQGNEIKETLSRRRFLAVLFGYCATLSIGIYAFGVLSVHVSLVSTAPAWADSLVWFIGQVGWALYTWMICSLLVVTLLGLHYLVERMHRA
jgi:hypothetical protein